jgi:hypothetical protein
MRLAAVPKDTTRTVFLSTLIDTDGTNQCPVTRETWLEPVSTLPIDASATGKSAVLIGKISKTCMVIVAHTALQRLLTMDMAHRDHQKIVSRTIQADERNTAILRGLLSTVRRFTTPNGT